MGPQLFDAGIALMVLGAAMAFVAALILASGLGSREGEASSGRGAAVIFIGPIPIAVGSDRGTLLIAVLLALSMVLVLFIMYSGVVRA